ncbi:hypothetical protein B0H12DRAFT_1224107 [Mycena haematopus]|nr:hypothetical protein B0H12DRAFT_1224107 [Mycena haematopus]
MSAILISEAPWSVDFVLETGARRRSSCGRRPARRAGCDYEGVVRLDAGHSHSFSVQCNGFVVDNYMENKLTDGVGLGNIPAGGANINTMREPRGRTQANKSKLRLCALRSIIEEKGLVDGADQKGGIAYTLCYNHIVPPPATHTHSESPSLLVLEVFALCWPVTFAEAVAYVWLTISSPVQAPD